MKKQKFSVKKQLKKYSKSGKEETQGSATGDTFSPLPMTQQSHRTEFTDMKVSLKLQDLANDLSPQP